MQYYYRLQDVFVKIMASRKFCRFALCSDFYIFSM